MEAALITGKANSLENTQQMAPLLSFHIDFYMPDEILALDVYLFCKRMFL